MKWRFLSGSLALAGVLSVTAGCALKDPPTVADIRAQGLPGVETPDGWQAPAAAGAVGEDWLASFDDDQLEGLVAEALAYSPDLFLAAARVEESAAGLKAAGANLLPAVDLMGRTGGKLGGDFTGTSGALLSAVWEADLWGRVRYGKRAAEETYISAENDLAFARQSLAALVAKAWFLATESVLQHEIAKLMVTDTEAAVALAEDRLRVGAGNELDLTLARQSLGTARDAERSLDLARREAIRAVEVLVGRYPGARLETVKTLPALTDSIPTGLPSELLERRLDVIAAQRRIAAAFSRVEEARAARLPTISLTAGLSHITSDLFVLEDRDDIVESVGITAFLPIFRGGELVAAIEARSAQQKQAVAIWAQTGLKAFSEVESALAREASFAEREPILAAQLALSQHALELERVRYRVGTTDMRPVLQQQLAMYSVQTALLRVQSERRVQRVNLYVALGGDFGVEAAMAAIASR